MTASNKALFLDRDGIVIFDSGYAKESNKVTLIPGIAALIRRARAAGWKVVVVTNQSGLGRGWITLDQYKSVSHRMLELLHAQNTNVDGVYFAPFYEPESPGPEFLHEPCFDHHGTPEKGLWNMAWRKPWPGMIWKAALEHAIDLQHSIMIGDRITDQIAGQLAGVRKSYLFKSEAHENEINDLSVWESRRASIIREIRGWLSTEPQMQVHTPHLDRAEVTPFYTHLIEDFAEVELA